MLYIKHGEVNQTQKKVNHFRPKPNSGTMTPREKEKKNEGKPNNILYIYTIRNISYRKISPNPPSPIGLRSGGSKTKYLEKE